MSVTIAVGAQGGDEGKGKIIDYLAADYDLVVRYQGGNNAAHTVMIQGKPYILHLIPSGIFRAGTDVLLGTGMVVDPDALLKEMLFLRENNISPERIYLSEKAHILFPYHRLLDTKSDQKHGIIDTTHRGIGPAYMDKVSREGLRFADLKHPEIIKEKIEVILPRINTLLKHYGCQTFTADGLYQHCLKWRRLVLPHLVEPVSFLQNYLSGRKKILLEGQLGLLRDLDLGTYPYVTSSSPTAAYACAVSGIPIHKVDQIVGVARAYPILAGNGPFPTEMDPRTASVLRGTGENPDDEYGGTTGRKRRIGWLDIPALKYSSSVNGYTQLALCKLDKLDAFSEIKVCTHYQLNGQIIDYMPDTAELHRVTPCYEVLPGWLASTRSIRSIADLPKNARAYLQLIENSIQVPIKYVGVGPDRCEIAV
ncbi:adenylosuccinate synthase [Ruminococcus gauvreauii]|uniref:adenylosuccinate synthase n=1 Tax=Ruminococcus gauvreauii TaxID=438033 RepID=UPI003984540B